MFRSLLETQKELGRSILEGERYEKNVRGISLVALLLVIVNVVTGCLNLVNGYYSAAVTSPLFILAGLLILYFIRIRHDRTGAVITAVIAVVIIFTYGAFTVQHGFTIFWTLLLPLGFGYFANVRAGIGLSFYFLALYWILFYTPLRETLGAQYSDIIAQRFPILYLADVVLTSFIMVQYHRTTLHQLDYAKQLMDAKAAADKANAAKSDFLTNMSHEIRTPINAVLGMNEMIMRESAKARAQFGSDSDSDSQDPRRKAFENIGIYAGDVKSAGTNLLAIINNILDFSKIEANRMELVEAEYQFSSVLNDVSNLVYFKAKEKGLAFFMDVDETIPDALYGDEVRVRQVITNVLANAVKYTKQGSVALSIRREEISAPEPGRTITLNVSVRDTGIGIKKEDIDKLFTKFERVDLKQNSTVEGTGLGLAITQALLTMMGGQIFVESEFGKGSVFTILLPQKVVSSEPVGNFRERFEKSMLESGVYKESFHAPQARVLIVDDTQMNLAVAVRLLKATGVRIDTADSGAEALSRTMDTAYDLIFMDQRMPEMDGTQTMRRIKAQEGGANRETPIICLTADAIIGAKERYISEGFTDYLTKPVQGASLEKALMKYLPPEKVQPERNDMPYLTSLQVETEKQRETEIQQTGLIDFGQLRAAGICPETGLGYCQGDEEFYSSILEEYARNAAEKTPEMQRCFDASDWKGYAVLVHALKSTSRMIGAESLAELAAEQEAAANREAKAEQEAARSRAAANREAAVSQEAAANEGCEEEIRNRHPQMVSQYEAAVKAIRAALPGLTMKKTEADKTGDDGEILEFAPEEDEDGEILEFGPEEDEEGEILEFAPVEGGDGEILEFFPEETS